MAQGYWETNDPHDDLGAGIQSKLSKGSPQYNTLLEDSRMAVLFQNRAEAMHTNVHFAEQTASAI